jgi:GT2 family glycosyltransferase
MAKATLNVTTNYKGRLLKPGDDIDVEERVLNRWIRKGIAKISGSVIFEPPEPAVVEPVNREAFNTAISPKVSIIILVKDTLYCFKRCLASVIKYSVNYELIIVDNGSKDVNRKYIQDAQAKYGFTLIINQKNMGFAYGCNQGIKAAKCDYVCFLNSDTIVTRGWLAKLLKGFEADEDVGAVGPSTCWASGKQMVNQYANKRFDMSDEDIQKISLPEEYQEFVYPDYLIGFCLLVKREVIDKIGGFDHKAFPIALGEDVDFILRIQKAGYKTYHVKGCYIHHFGSRTIIESKMKWQQLARDNKPALVNKKDRIAKGEVFVENDTTLKKAKKKLNKINVIIPTLDRPDMTAKTLEELFKNNENIRVVIIDNGSDDLSYLERFDVGIIQNKKNVGVSKSFNQGLDIADSKYVVLMHNDLLIYTKDWIKIAITFMEKNAYVGAVGQAGWTSLNVDATRRTKENPVGWWIGSLKTTIERYKVKPNGFEEVAILDGCCNIVRNNGVRIDERLPYYFYDYDLAIQYKNLGYRVYVMGGSALHFADDRKVATINLDKCKRPQEQELQARNIAREYLLDKWKEVLPLSV